MSLRPWTLRWPLAARLLCVLLLWLPFLVHMFCGLWNGFLEGVAEARRMWTFVATGKDC